MVRAPIDMRRDRWGAGRLFESQAQTAPRVVFEPAPAWADLPPVIPAERPAPEHAEEGRCFWLTDSQFRLVGAELHALERSVVEVTSPAGLGAAGSLSMDFDPAFQTLVVHHVRVIRDGAVREVDAGRGLELLRRERDLERAMFDGRLTAHLSIPDVRVGDIVDVCQSYIGAHPVTGHRFAAEWRFNWGCWVGETRVRLLSEAGRDLTIQSWNGAPECEMETPADGEVVRTWRSFATEPATLEAVAPNWERQFATVRVADPMTWRDVADTFRGFYGPEPLTADLEAEAAAIETAGGRAADQVVQALRLVQGGLRYHSIAIGEGGFAPRGLAEIWESRTGDCKDASRLLVALLQRLGMYAVAVLVNTQRGQALTAEAPSLSAFDHCIVGLTLDGRRYWLDPTRFPQGGRLDVLIQPRLGMALPLVEGATLEDMGVEPLAESIATREVFELPPSPDLPGRLRVETTHFGWRADLMRQRLAGGIATVSREFRAFYERRYGAPGDVQPLEVTDDLENNRLKIVESFEINQIWRRGAEGNVVIFETFDDVFLPYLPGVAHEDRRLPIDLGMPLRAISVVEIHTPMRTPPGEWDHTFEMKGLRATSKFSAADADGKTLKLVRSLTFERPLVDAKSAREFADFRKDALLNSAVFVHQAVRNGRFVSGNAKLTITQKIWGALVLIWIVAGIGRAVIGAG